jgi:hypothetical protein
MLASGPIVVRLLNSTDWPALWASIATAVAAVAGIAGTAWQSRQTVLQAHLAAERAADEAARDRLRVRRNAYTAGLSSLTAAWEATLRAREFPAESQVGADRRTEAEARIAESVRAFTELQLTASHGVVSDSGEVLSLIVRYLNEGSIDSDDPAGRSFAFDEAYYKLLTAMRADLDEAMPDEHLIAEPSEV